MKRQLISGLTAFLLAAAVGFFVESSSLQASSTANRKTILKTVSHILTSLSPFLGDSLLIVPPTRPFSDLPDMSDEMAKTVLSARIMGGFPDKTFRPNTELSRAEGLEIFGRTLDFIRSHLAHPQSILEKSPVFEDVGPDHWLQPILGKLAGIGVSFASYQHRLLPSEPFSSSEALAIASAMIEYFKSEMVIGEWNGSSIRLLAKGTLFPIRLQGWKYCWSAAMAETDPAWKEVSAQGVIPVSLMNEGMVPRLILSHEQFFPVEIPVRSVESPTVFFMKIRRRSIYPSSFAGYREDVPVRAVPPEPSHQNRVEVPAPEVFPTDLDQEFSAVSDDRSPVEPQKAEREAARWRTRPPETPSTIVEPIDPAPIDKEFVYGSVIHSLTRKGIGGATILAGSRQVVTDADGRFVIPQVKEPILEMTIYCEGCESLFIKHRVGYKPGPLMLALKPLQATLEGRVEDAETGHPIVGASLSVGDRLIKTDAGGTFKVTPLPYTYHQIACQAPGYMDNMELVLLESQETFKILRLNRLTNKTLSNAIIETAVPGSQPQKGIN